MAAHTLFSGVRVHVWKPSFTPDDLAHWTSVLATHGATLTPEPRAGDDAPCVVVANVFPERQACLRWVVAHPGCTIVHTDWVGDCVYHGERVRTAPYEYERWREWPPTPPRLRAANPPLRPSQLLDPDNALPVPADFIDAWIPLVLGSDWARQWGGPRCFITLRDIVVAYQDNLNAPFW